MDSAAMKRVVDGLPTKAAKIRALNDRGVPRAEIARFLGLRYQHVRNTLERPRPASEASDEASGFAEAARGVGRPEEPTCVTRVRVDAEGGVSLPAEVLAAIQAGPGDVLMARMKDGEVRLFSPAAAIRRAQELVARFDRGEGSVVDELIAERRAEAAREEEEMRDRRQSSSASA